MKYTPEHLDTLRSAISPLDTEDTRQAYRDFKIPRADKVKDIDTRYRWDLLWAAARVDRSLYDVLSNYQTAHTDTALRKIVSAL